MNDINDSIIYATWNAVSDETWYAIKDIIFDRTSDATWNTIYVDLTDIEKNI